MPDPISDTRRWFELVDLDGDGHLSREEVISALRAQLPLDLRAIDAAAADDAMWRRFDPDASGMARIHPDTSIGVTPGSHVNQLSPSDME